MSLWRDICEYLHEQKYHQASSLSILSVCGESRNLIHYDRTRREVLWHQYKIQLIIWDDRREVWQLKGNWEDKIWFLEQVYILDRDPATLRRIWLEKWEKKQAMEAIAVQKQAVQAYYCAIDNYLSDIEYRIDRILQRWNYALAANNDSDRNYYLQYCQKQTV